jgi:hypothetical protein
MRALAHAVSLREVNDPLPRRTPTTEFSGENGYAYAGESGVYVATVEPGAEERKVQPAARIHFHDTPWRKPASVGSARDFRAFCKRPPARCERDDCPILLPTDIQLRNAPSRRQAAQIEDQKKYAP